MTWARVVSALRRVAMGSRSPARFLSAATRSPHGPAQSTAPKSKPVGSHGVDLRARAERLHNRNRAAARRYLATHAALIKEASYDH